MVVLYRGAIEELLHMGQCEPMVAAAVFLQRLLPFTSTKDGAPVLLPWLLPSVTVMFYDAGVSHGDASSMFYSSKLRLCRLCRVGMEKTKICWLEIDF